MICRDVPAVARFQDGVFTAVQAIEDGLSARQVRRRLEAGRWVQVAGRGLAAAPMDGHARYPSRMLARAARLTWPEAVACRRTAAGVLGFPVAPGATAQVSARAGRRPWGRLEPHGPAVPRSDVVSLAGLLVTHRLRTAVDCLGLLPFEESLDLYAWLTTRRVVSRGEVAAATRERFDQIGVPQLRRVLNLTRHGAVSAAEVRVHGLLRAAGVTGWQPNTSIMVGQQVIAVADLLFRRERVIVEVDGLRAHSGQEAFVRDRRRQNALVAAGYLVLRFTWWDVVERPEAIANEIIHTLQLRRDPRSLS
jgi:very-short-patch-repair endonuclease